MNEQDIAHVIIDMVRDWVKHASEPRERIETLADERIGETRILEVLDWMDERINMPVNPDA